MFFRIFRLHVMFFLTVFWNTSTFAYSTPQDITFHDLVVVGATFSGIAASINAAKYGHSVVIVEEYPMIGGLMTGGLSFTDFISYESLGGTFRDYMQRVEDYYSRRYGKESKQFQDCHGGIHAEPHVTLLIFEEMLSEYPNIRVLTDHRIESVFLDKPDKDAKKIKGVHFKNLKTNETVALLGKTFIDATYEGDLAAFAGAEYRIGRESRQEYGEPYAGKLFLDKGKMLVGSTGQGDYRVQGYNFRLIMTNDSKNQVKIDQPKGYKRKEYLPIAEVLQQEKVSQVFVEKSRDGIFRLQMLPNNKADVNDIKNAPVRMALLGENYDYPDGDWPTRKRIIDRHKEHILGMVYFIQNDPSIPKKYKKEAQQWGLAKDEFTDNENFPTRLYIREARRIMGNYVFTQNDVNTIDSSLVVALKRDAIAIGDYALNCHGVSPASLYPSIAEGDYNYIPPPFQIPFGVILPKGFSNLLVSVAVSSSHVGFSGLRLEPIWTGLGQAAGLTAHLAMENDIKVSEVVVGSVQELLHQNRAKTVYISDIEADSKYFKAAQYLGVRGFLHDVYLTYKEQMPGVKTYKSIRGTQYAHAFPFHELKPEKTIERELAKKWIDRLDSQNDKNEAQKYLKVHSPTRGAFLLKIYDLLKNGD
ncbi:FAD-dependent oxidoreductase [Ulvibacterium sp.]|uniref:FAD-dependent oxidoreductase n=1 Tax=Ulvibacterium sp. TaxID=2665914 RepID=UPI003BAAA754